VLSAHLHPEFGLLCPSRGLRRVLQAAFALVAVGVIAAASSMAALIGDSDDRSLARTAPAVTTAELPPQQAATPTKVDAGGAPAIKSQVPRAAPGQGQCLQARGRDGR
jgi:hypothetical protein